MGCWGVLPAGKEPTDKERDHIPLYRTGPGPQHLHHRDHDPWSTFSTSQLRWCPLQIGLPWPASALPALPSARSQRCRDYFSSCKQAILPFPPPFPVMQPFVFIKGDWWWGKKNNMQNTSQYPYKHTFICIIILNIITMTFALVCNVFLNTWK